MYLIVGGNTDTVVLDRKVGTGPVQVLAVEVGARLVGAGHCASAWRLEIKRGDEALVRDHVTALWVDDAGKPARGNW